MPAWPKSLLTIGANVLSARTAARLRRNTSKADQALAFRALLKRLATASLWRDAGVTGEMTYDAFRSTVPPKRYDDLKPAIVRMRDGERDVLWPGECRYFVSTSGTSSGAAKLLPVTDEMLTHLRCGCRDAMLYYTARVPSSGVFRGRHLFLTGSTTLKPIGSGAAAAARTGEWPAIAALNLPHWLETQFVEPGAEIAQMDDWQAKLEATVARVRSADLSMIAGMPSWTLSFAQLVQAKCGDSGQRIENLQALWPKLECYIHGGVPLSPYATELRNLLGPTVKFHEVYAGAEGFYAAQDTPTTGDLRLMADLGLFFEFIPLSEYDETRLESLGRNAYSLADVKRGIDYVVLLTTPGGLARYVVGDIVRFTSVEPPRLTVVGRVALHLSAFGEFVLERDVTEALVTVCQRHRWNIVNYHVAPLVGVKLTGQAHGRHEWWVELKPGTMETPTGPQMAGELDLELQRINRSYAERRSWGRIDAPTVRLVMPGVFRHWLKFHDRWGGQNKVVRCRSDRLIADELAQITKFAHDQG